jgi:alpha-beta hydrolase superfamily lysophospholipase
MSHHSAKTLVATQTEDGLQLDGVLIQPAANPGSLVFVWIHGFGANFYFGPYLRLGEALAAQGYNSLIGNTRGHDFGTLLEPAKGTPYLGGAAWERLEDSHYDLAAWIEFARRSGFAGSALVGHSLGASKVIAYQAQRQDPHVQAVALISPPLRPSWSTCAHPAALAQAEQLAAAGRAETLFDGPWGPVSAQTYLSLDRFGINQFSRETSAPNLALIRCPLLVLLGNQDTFVATEDDLELIRENAVAAPQVATQVIEGAGHFYAQHEQDVAAILARWTDALQGHQR